MKERILRLWKQFTDKQSVQKVFAFCKKTGIVLTLTAKWAYQLRSILLAIPVAVCAGALAIRNLRLLPAAVGVNMLASGEYQWMVNRGVAVMAPLAVTALCLLMMFISKKVLYPWLVSVLSLALPLVIWITNVFPA